MYKQNVQNLVEYIKNNKSIPIAQLEEAALKIGYLQEEFNQAFAMAVNNQGNQNITANAANINQEVIPVNEYKQTNYLLIAMIGMIIVFAISTGGYYILGQTKTKNANKQRPNPSNSRTMKVPSLKPTYVQTIYSPTPKPQVDSLSAFSGLFLNNDYKITTSGKIEHKTQNDGFSNKFTFNLNYGTVYTQKGNIIRSDSNDPLKTEFGFKKGGMLYLFNPAEKTYIIIKETDSMGQYLISAFDYSFPLSTLMYETQKKTLTWKQITSNEWLTNWILKMPFDLDQTPISTQVKIKFDPTSTLVTTLSMRFEENKPWQDVTLKYEKIGNIEDFLSIPAGYTEEKIEQ